MKARIDEATETANLNLSKLLLFKNTVFKVSGQVLKRFILSIVVQIIILGVFFRDLTA